MRVPIVADSYCFKHTAVVSNFIMNAGLSKFFLIFSLKTRKRGLLQRVAGKDKTRFSSSEMTNDVEKGLATILEGKLPAFLDQGCFGSAQTFETIVELFEPLVRLLVS